MCAEIFKFQFLTFPLGAKFYPHGLNILQGRGRGEEPLFAPSFLTIESVHP
jgi:hypothetical protein